MARHRRSRNHRWTSELLEDRTLLDSSNPVRLLGDVNSETLDTRLEQLTPYRDEVAFLADDALYASDGTEAGTRRIGLEESHMRLWNSVGDNLLYRAGGDLWASDGAQSVKLLDDVRDGFHPIEALDRVGFMARNTNTFGYDTYITDGTSEGTIQLTDSQDGYRASHMASTHSQLFLIRYRGDPDGAELWVSNGTREGTNAVSGPVLNQARNLTPVGERMFFLTEDESEKMTLWVSDGTETGTKAISGPLSEVDRFAPVGERLFFVAENESGSTTLWVSDGTANGTKAVTNLSSAPGSMLALANKLILTFHQHRVSSEFWSSDGTEDGTMLLRQFDYNQGERPAGLTNYGGHVFFQSDQQLWRTDGTPSGTELVESIGEPIQGLTATTDRLFISTDDSIHAWHPTGREKVFETKRNKRFDSMSPAAVGSRVFFRGSTNTGTELWVSDGSRDGTNLVIDLNQDGRGSDPWFLHGVDEFGVFTADDGTNRLQKWITDGDTVRALEATQSGSEVSAVHHHVGDDDFLTIPVDGLPTHSELEQLIGWSPEVEFNEITRVGNRYFFLHELEERQELWVTDLTPAGTTLVQRFSADHASNLAELNGELIFFTGTIVRLSDGTKEGTRRIGTLRGVGDSLIVEGGYAYFTRWFPSRSVIFRTDGTEAGTTKLPQSDHVYGLGVVDEQLFFQMGPFLDRTVWSIDLSNPEFGAVNIGIASDSTEFIPYGNHMCVLESLRCTDGTSEGTTQISPAGGDDLIVVGDMLVWSAGELYASDGTPEGVRQLTDIEPGRESSFPTEMTMIGDELVFFAGNTQYGREPWALTMRDYGDAPQPYASTVMNDGASHDPSSLFLGKKVTSEIDAMFSVGDSGDDGVRWRTRIVAGKTAKVDVTISEPGYLDAWVDYNGDGAWQAAEQIFESLELEAGRTPLTFDVPTDSPYQELAYARFRVSKTGDLSPTGYGSAGEVEDYGIRIIGPGIWQIGTEVRVLGTTGNDEITMTAVRGKSWPFPVEYAVTVGDRVRSFAPSEISRIKIDSRTGHDQIEIRSHPELSKAAETRPALIETGPGDDTIFGGALADTIRSGSGDDRVFGRDGSDLIYAGSGDDHVQSGGDNDTINAGAGNDFLSGGSGDDVLDGGEDHDVAVAGKGHDTVTGSDGFDILIGGEGSDLLNGGVGQDIVLPGGTTYKKSQLMAIHSEWLPKTGYANKVARLRGTKDGATYLLTVGSVLNDNGSDTLFGNTARDWFFASDTDSLEDRKRTEPLDLL